MAKASKKTTPLDTGTSAMSAALNPIRNAEGMAVWLEIMNESARFVADRFQQDLETQQAILDCRKPEDLFRLQSEFYSKAMEQYTVEATRMAHLMTKATVKTMQDVKTGQARSYDDVPL